MYLLEDEAHKAGTIPSGLPYYKIAIKIIKEEIKNSLRITTISYHLIEYRVLTFF